MKLKEIADRIDAHLKRFERDPKINKDRSGNGLHDYFWAGAHVAGRYVGVCYISYQGSRNLTKDDAIRYLNALDNGFEGGHYEALKRAGDGERR